MVELKFVQTGTQKGTVIVGKTMNTLCRFWPNRVSMAFVDRMRKDSREGRSFMDEGFGRCRALLCEIHPFYKTLLDAMTSEEQKCYICSFFAGAYGFFNLFYRKPYGKKIEAEMLTTYFGTETYADIMERCGADEDNLMADSFFGDYVRSFRLIELVFRTITDSGVYGEGQPDKEQQDQDQNQEEEQNSGEKALLADIQERLRSALRLCYLIYDAPAELEAEGQTEDDILNPYLSHCLTKERAQNPTLFLKFASYNDKLIKTQLCEKENIRVNSLYEAVKEEMDHIAAAVLTKKMYIRKCVACGDFYIDSTEINRSRRDHEFYCSTPCRNYGKRWTARFQAFASALKTSFPRGLPEKVQRLMWILNEANCLETINEKLREAGIQKETYETAYYILLTALYRNGVSNIEDDYTIAAYYFLNPPFPKDPTSPFKNLCFGTISYIQNYLKVCSTPKRLKIKCRENNDYETNTVFIWEVIQFRKKEQGKHERDYMCLQKKSLFELAIPSEKTYKDAEGGEQS